MNYGTDTLHVGDEVPVRYQIDAEAVVEETAVIAAEVLPDSLFEYTFATASDMSAIKAYTLTAFTELDYDDDLTNDATPVIIEVYGYTPIDLGPDTVVRAFEYTLDAGAGYDSYLWQDGSTNQTLLINTTGQYKVMETKGSMCENSDSLLVTIVIPDIGIERLFNPTDGCGYSATEHVEFYVLNLGTDTLYTNDSIFISYQLDGGSLVYDTLSIDQVVLPEDSILFSSAGTVDVSSLGTYQFSVDVSYAKDIVLGNNHLDQSMEVFGAPTVSLGPDQVVNSTTHTLDAGGGFVSYLWQDGSFDQLFVVEYDNQTVDSTYSVTITDIHGCDASDDIKISFDLWDVGVSSIASPNSACTLTVGEELRLYVTNFGTHPIVDEMISIVFSVDGSSPVTGMYTLTQVLNPGDSLELLLGSAFDFSRVGDHTVSAYSVYAKDDDPHNDAIDVVITHFGSPEPELGGVN
ncbi:MAG: hypothetical protein KAS29_02940, partial [Bacteroidales bacterium]|nr:hypothetical protein [Bacteroidales bacterium]